MFYWVTVLDRFDAILSRICNEYNLKDIQTKRFASETKLLLLSILEFSRTLFENSTNRNIYNSYDVTYLLFITSYSISFNSLVIEPVLVIKHV